MVTVMQARLPAEHLPMCVLSGSGVLKCREHRLVQYRMQLGSRQSRCLKQLSPHAGITSTVMGTGLNYLAAMQVGLGANAGCDLHLLSEEALLLWKPCRAKQPL